MRLAMVIKVTKKVKIPEPQPNWSMVREQARSSRT